MIKTENWAVSDDVWYNTCTIKKQNKTSYQNEILYKLMAIYIPTYTSETWTITRTAANADVWN